MPGGGNMMGYSGGGSSSGGAGGKSTTSDIENMEWNIGTAQLPHVVRYGSGSSQTSQSSGDICRICHCESDLHNPLLTPCYCSGSLKYVHQTCLQQWLTASETNSCELCKFPFIMHTKIKPFNEWESLEMSGVERRRLCCAVLFHCAAAICVIWSLCVLIERAAEEVKRGQIGWPFWTKLVVVTVGLTGGMVFMVIQCRQYFHLCQRWRARNRILLIQNAPEKMHPISPPSPVLVSRHQQQQPYQQHHHHHLPRSSSGSNSHGGGGAGGGGIGGAMHMPAGFVCGGISNPDACSSHAHCPSLSSGGGMSASTQHHQHLYQQQHQQQPNSMATTSAGSGAGGSGGRPSHGQIVANIENNPLHYERDWQLDDSSQSSFRPCPQGSGSMTPMPFHDSGHNMYETVSVTTNAAASQLQQQQQPAAAGAGPRRSASNSTTGSLVFDPLTQTVAVQPEPQSAQLQHYQHTHRANIKQQLQQQQPHTPELALFQNAATTQPPASNSAVFLENSDILNDVQYPKLYHRHSTAYPEDSAVLQSPQSVHPAAAHQMDTRRFSDSRLLQEPPIFNVTSVLGAAVPLDANDSGANVTEIVFGESAGAARAAAAASHSGGGSPYDALELNIQEMLELDGGRMAAHRRCAAQGGDARKARHSLHNVSTTLDGALQMLAGSGGQGVMRTGAAGAESIGGDVGGVATAAELRQARMGASTFKSLPNLSASSENLLQQQHK